MSDTSAIMSADTSATAADGALERAERGRDAVAPQARALQPGGRLGVGWRRWMWLAAAAAAVGAVCLLLLYVTSSVVLDQVPGPSRLDADVVHLPTTPITSNAHSGGGSERDTTSSSGSGDGSTRASSGSGSAPLDSSGDSTTGSGSEAGDATSASGSGSGSGAAAGGGGSSSSSVVANDTVIGPRFPMSGEAMARVVARPWPEHVYTETSSRDKLCHGRRPVNLTSLAARRVCLVVVSYRAPRSLENSVRSWARAGLLDLVDDKIMWLNAATDQERALGAEFGFRVLEPRNMTYHVFKTDFPQAFKGRRPQRLPALVVGSERNSWTVGPSLVHAADMTDADYVLFLEKDFMIEDHVDAEHVRAELLNALLYLERGVKIVRLRQRRDQGQVGFPDCCSKQCHRVNYNGRDSFARQYNWFSFFCDTLPQEAVSRKLVAECDGRRTRCFTSFDSNWSNNPFIIDRQYIFNGEKGGNIAKIALWSSSQKSNAYFEVNELKDNWGRHHTPICQSWHGLFHHKEVDQ